MRLISALVLLPFALLHAPVLAATTDPCANVRAFNALTLDCQGQCSSLSSSCVVYDHSGSSSTPCDNNRSGTSSPMSRCVSPSSTTNPCLFQCFTAYAERSTFKFLVPFNVSRSAPLVGAEVDTTDAAPYESNEFVRRIAPLALSSAVTKVIIAGGRDANSATKGRVIDLDIDPDFLVQSPQVTGVALLNINIGDRLSDVASLFPENLEVLDLTNTRLSAAPPSLRRLVSLDKITLSNNYLTEWPATLELPKLKALNLQGNQLRVFNTSSTTLTTLDLSANNFTAIPPAVYNLSSLKVLKLKDNPIQRLRLSVDQHAFLRQLEELEMDSTVFDATNCPQASVQSLGDGQVFDTKTSKTSDSSEAEVTASFGLSSIVSLDCSRRSA
ncbi:hypothetical protein PINS_up012231 [Pythium insidiosum]|nr:hypothetical protein PINS_up012231 [Pythium insidiosum]